MFNRNPQPGEIVVSHTIVTRDGVDYEHIDFQDKETKAERSDEQAVVKADFDKIIAPLQARLDKFQELKDACSE